MTRGPWAQKTPGVLVGCLLGAGLTLLFVAQSGSLTLAETGPRIAAEGEGVGMVAGIGGDDATSASGRSAGDSRFTRDTPDRLGDSQARASIDSAAYPFLRQGFGGSVGAEYDSVARERERRDAERFQAFLHAHQHPNWCGYEGTAAKGMHRQPKEPGEGVYVMQPHAYGLGSQIHVSAMSLLEAVAANLTFVLPWKSQYVAPSRCASQTWTCTFQGVSACGESDVERARAAQPAGCSDRAVFRTADAFSKKGCRFIMRKQSQAGAFASSWLGFRGIIQGLRRRANIKGEYGSLFYFREAVRYLLRPNAKMRAFGQTLRSAIKGLPAGADLSRAIAVHVRQGEDRMRRPQYSTEEYAKIVHMKMQNQGGFKYVLLSSNKRSVYQEFPRALEKLRKGYRAADFEIPRVVSVPASFFAALGDGNRETARALDGYDNAGGEFDEMMVMVSQAYLFAQCGAFVGTLHHNIGQLVWELASAWHFTPTPNAYDMAGSPWFSGWWASMDPHGPHHPRPSGGKFKS